MWDTGIVNKGWTMTLGIWLSFLQSNSLLDTHHFSLDLSFS